MNNIYYNLSKFMVWRSISVWVIVQPQLQLSTQTAVRIPNWDCPCHELSGYSIKQWCSGNWQCMTHSHFPKKGRVACHAKQWPTPPSITMSQQLLQISCTRAPAIAGSTALPLGQFCWVLVYLNNWDYC